MAFDPADGYVVLFGGARANSVDSPLTALRDTWTYRNGQWSELCSGSTATPACPSSPPAGPASMAYDPLLSAVVLLAVDGSLWSFQAGQWTALNVTGGPGKCLFMGLVADLFCGQPVEPMVYDPALGAVVIMNYTAQWAFANGTLTALGNTSSRGFCTGAAIFYNSADNTLECLSNDRYSGTRLWRWEGGNWTMIATPSAPAPSPVNVQVAEFDPILGAAVVQFGNSYANQPVPGYTWLLRNTTWTNISDALPSIPPAGFGWAEMVWDAADHTSVLLDGVYPNDSSSTGLVEYNFTWALFEHLSVAVSATPAALELGQNLSLTYAVVGGVGPITTNITGVPPGCSDPVQGSLEVCRPSETGAYSLQVTAYDPQGNASAGGFANVSVYADLNASVMESATAVTVGEPDTFTAGVTGGDPPFGIVWFWDDGSTTVAGAATHAWPDTGAHYVTCTVTDQLGDSRTASGEVFVNPSLAVTLATNITATDVGLPVALTPTIYGGTAPFRAEWSFDTLTVVPASMARYAFPVAGVQPVTSWITDASGASASGRVDVAVAWDPTVQLIANVTSTTSGSPIQFSVDLQGGTAPFDVEWSCGDGHTGSYSGNNTTLVFDHAFAPNANFTVAVNSTDAVGQRAHSSLPITVFPAIANSTTLPPGRPAPQAVSMSGLPLVVVTATVAAVGLLVIYQWRRRSRR